MSVWSRSHSDLALLARTIQHNNSRTRLRLTQRGSQPRTRSLSPGTASASRAAKTSRRAASSGSGAGTARGSSCNGLSPLSAHVDVTSRTRPDRDSPSSVSSGETPQTLAALNGDESGQSDVMCDTATSELSDVFSASPPAHLPTFHVRHNGTSPVKTTTTSSASRSFTFSDVSSPSPPAEEVSTSSGTEGKQTGVEDWKDQAETPWAWLGSSSSLTNSLMSHMSPSPRLSSRSPDLLKKLKAVTFSISSTKASHAANGRDKDGCTGPGLHSGAAAPLGTPARAGGVCAEQEGGETREASPREENQSPPPARPACREAHTSRAPPARHPIQISPGGWRGDISDDGAEPGPSVGGHCAGRVLNAAQNDGSNGHRQAALTPCGSDVTACDSVQETNHTPQETNHTPQETNHTSQETPPESNGYEKVVDAERADREPSEVLGAGRPQSVLDSSSPVDVCAVASPRALPVRQSAFRVHDLDLTLVPLSAIGIVIGGSGSRADFVRRAADPSAGPDGNSLHTGRGFESNSDPMLATGETHLATGETCLPVANGTPCPRDDVTTEQDDVTDTRGDVMMVGPVTGWTLGQDTCPLTRTTQETPHHHSNHTPSPRVSSSGPAPCLHGDTTAPQRSTDRQAVERKVSTVILRETRIAETQRDSLCPGTQTAENQKELQSEATAVHHRETQTGNDGNNLESDATTLSPEAQTLTDLNSPQSEATSISRQTHTVTDLNNPQSEATSISRQTHTVTDLNSPQSEATSISRQTHPVTDLNSPQSEATSISRQTHTVTDLNSPQSEATSISRQTHTVTDLNNPQSEATSISRQTHTVTDLNNPQSEATSISRQTHPVTDLNSPQSEATSISRQTHTVTDLNSPQSEATSISRQTHTVTDQLNARSGATTLSQQTQTTEDTTRSEDRTHGAVSGPETTTAKVKSRSQPAAPCCAPANKSVGSSSSGIEADCSDWPDRDGQQCRDPSHSGSVAGCQETSPSRSSSFGSQLSYHVICGLRRDAISSEEPSRSVCSAHDEGSSPGDWASSGQGSFSSDSHSTCQGNSSENHSTGQGNSPENHSTCQGNSPENHSTCLGNSAENHSTCQGNSPENHSTCQGNSQENHSTGQGNSAENHSTCQGNSSDSHSTCQGNSSDSHSTCQGNSSDSHSTCQGNSSDNHSTCQGNSSDSHSTCQGNSSDNHSTCQGNSLDNHSTCQGNSSDSHSTCQGNSLDNHFTCQGNSSDNHSTCQGNSLDNHSTCQGNSLDNHSTCQGNSSDNHSTCQGNSSDNHSTCQGNSSDSQSTCQGNSSEIPSPSVNDSTGTCRSEPVTPSADHVTQVSRHVRMTSHRRPRFSGGSSCSRLLNNRPCTPLPALGGAGSPPEGSPPPGRRRSAGSQDSSSRSLPLEGSASFDSGSDTDRSASVSLSGSRSRRRRGRRQEDGRGRKTVDADRGQEDGRGRKTVDADRGQEDQRGRKTLNANRGQEDGRGRKTLDADRGQEDGRGRKTLDADRGQEDGRGRKTCDADRGQEDGRGRKTLDADSSRSWDSLSSSSVDSLLSVTDVGSGSGYSSDVLNYMTSWGRSGQGRHGISGRRLSKVLRAVGQADLRGASGEAALSGVSRTLADLQHLYVSLSRNLEQRQHQQLIEQQQQRLRQQLAEDRALQEQRHLQQERQQREDEGCAQEGRLKEQYHHHHQLLHHHQQQQQQLLHEHQRLLQQHTHHLLQKQDQQPVQQQHQLPVHHHQQQPVHDQEQPVQQHQQQEAQHQQQPPRQQVADDPRPDRDPPAAEVTRFEPKQDLEPSLPFRLRLQHLSPEKRAAEIRKVRRSSDRGCPASPAPRVKKQTCLFHNLPTSAADLNQALIEEACKQTDLLDRLGVDREVFSPETKVRPVPGRQERQPRGTQHERKSCEAGEEEEDGAQGSGSEVSMMDTPEEAVLKLDDDFDKTLVNMKPHVLKLPHKADRQKCAVWIKKLCEPPSSGISGRRNRNAYAQVMLHMLKRGSIQTPFDKRPDDGPLPALPSYMSIYFDEPLDRPDGDMEKLPDWVEGELGETASSSLFRSHALGNPAATSTWASAPGNSLRATRQRFNAVFYSPRSHYRPHTSMGIPLDKDPGLSPIRGDHRQYTGYSADDLSMEVRHSPIHIHSPTNHERRQLPDVKRNQGATQPRPREQSDTELSQPMGVTGYSTATSYGKGAAFHDDTSLAKPSDKEIALRTKMIEAKFHEEKLRLQQKHDAAVQKILDRKNSEIEDVKSHYRSKTKEYEEMISRLERKVQTMVKEAGQVRETKDKQIAELKKMVEDSSDTQRNEYDKKFHDMEADFEQQKFEMQKLHTRNIQEILDDTNARLQRMEAEYNQQASSTTSVIKELESRVQQLMGEVDRTLSQRSTLEKEKAELQSTVDKLSSDLDEQIHRNNRLEREHQKKLESSEHDMRTLKNKTEASLEFLKQEHNISAAKATDTISDLEQQVDYLKKALKDAEEQRQRQMREADQVHQQDKLHLENLHDKQVRSMKKELEQLEQEMQRKLSRLEQLGQDKETEIQKQKELNKEQAAQADRALEEFKQQVDKNQTQIYADMKQQMELVEADLKKSKQAREKQGREFARQLEDQRYKHEHEMQELRMTLDNEKAQILHENHVQREMASAEHERDVEQLRDSHRNELKALEFRYKERQEKDAKVSGELEGQVVELREELVQANQLRKQQLVELGLLREEEKQKMQRDHEAEIARLKTDAEQQRLGLQKMHSAETERLLEKTNDRLKSIEREYMDKGKKSSETISELQISIKHLRDDIKRAKENAESRVADIRSQSEEEKLSLKKQYSSNMSMVQHELENQRRRCHNLERQIQKVEAEHEEKVTRLKLDHEDQMRAMLPGDMKMELEDTICSLKSQVSTLQQRAAMLQEELDLRLKSPLGQFGSRTSSPIKSSV